MYVEYRRIFVAVVMLHKGAHRVDCIVVDMNLLQRHSTVHSCLDLCLASVDFQTKRSRLLTHDIEAQQEDLLHLRK